MLSSPIHSITSSPRSLCLLQESLSSSHEPLLTDIPLKYSEAFFDHALSQSTLPSTSTWQSTTDPSALVRSSSTAKNMTFRYASPSLPSTPLPENRGLCRRTATRTTRQALRYVPIRSDPCGRFSRGRASSKFCVASQEYQPVLDASDALSHALVKMSLIFWRPRVSNGASKEVALGCYLHRAIHCWCRRA